MCAPRCSPSPNAFERRTSDAFEIYAPQVVTTDCLRCHTSWKMGDNGGALLCRFSTDSLTQSQQASAASMAKIKTSQITSGLVATILIAGFFVVLAIVVVRHQIAAPLAIVLEHLTGASTRCAPPPARSVPPARHSPKGPAARRPPWRKPAPRWRSWHP